MTYESLKSEIIGAPLTWLPGLLIVIVQQCVSRRVFQPDGLERTVKRAASEASR